MEGCGTANVWHCRRDIGLFGSTGVVGMKIAVSGVTGGHACS